MSQDDIQPEINKFLGDIIKANAASFKIDEEFKVCPGYGYNKFYLDSIEGSYDMGLQGLIHYIMYEEGLYKKVLNDKQYTDMEKAVEGDPEAIYGPDIEGDGEGLQQVLDEIYYESIAFVANELLKLGFDVKDVFCDYIECDV